jgi:hypothetical protein
MRLGSCRKPQKGLDNYGRMDITYEKIWGLTETFKARIEL